MTSIQKELGAEAPGMDEVEKAVATAFGKVFNLAPEAVNPPAASLATNA
jgi:hypothetical protein